LLHAIGAAKYSKIYVQSLQVIPGEEFAAVVASVKKFMNNGYIGTAHLDDAYLAKLADDEAIFFGMPLLNDPDEDIPTVAAELNKLYASEAAQGAVAFMGHGNPDNYDTFKANVRYTQLENALKKLNPNYFVGTVDMADNLKMDVLERMKEQNINSGKMYLHALMSIAGDHAHNDMAGEGDEYWTHPMMPEHAENSWYEFFTRTGYDVEVPVTNNHPLGLLELPGILNVWINHTKNAEFLEDAYHSMYPEE
jgi:sirohydrochlorin cobaltochelatase